jgi:type II secretory pathway predicted ATPase ExeA
MYTDHFGFTEPPFENNLDQRFLFLSKDHNEVLAALLFFIKENRPFAIICGDVGTGKTMVLNAFLDRLPASHHPIFISNPLVEYRDILNYVAETLKIENPAREVLPLIDKVKDALIAAKEKGHYYFLVIDEAHLLSDRSLDDIRLLSNIETRDRKLLQVLLVGQYELSHKLRRPEMRQLRQRISVNRFLSSLDSEETLTYIEHRLALVGSKFAQCFSPDCLPLIFSLTDGVPRQINHLCDSAFLIAKIEGRKKVTKDILRKTDETLKSDLVLTPQARSYKDFARSTFPRPRRLLALAGGTVALGAIVLASGYLVMQIGSRKAVPAAPLSEPSVLATKHRDSSPAGELGPSVHSSITAASPSSSSTTIQESDTHTPANPSPQPSEAAASPPASPQQLSPLNAEVAARSPSSSTGPANVVVADGDTIAGIAARYYPNDPVRSIPILLASNPEITDRNLIYPGQAIILPELSPGHSRTGPPATVTQGFFAIQLRQVFNEGKAVADVYARHLQEQGYSTSLSEIPSSQGRVSYALRFGTYETEQKAREAAAAFERAEHAPCLVVPLLEGGPQSAEKLPVGTPNVSAPSSTEDLHKPPPGARVP